MKEVWRNIPGYESRYQVSNKGRVRSLNRFTEDVLGRTRYRRGQILKPTPDLDGYLLVNLPDWKSAPVHRLVLLAFKGKPSPRILKACHRNGKLQDNRVRNLVYQTQKKNIHDKKRHGTHLEGEQVPNALLTKVQVKGIKKKLGRVTQEVLAAKYKVSRAAISQIAVGNNWRHV
jgi:hypothetical protein